MSRLPEKIRLLGGIAMSGLLVATASPVLAQDTSTAGSEAPTQDASSSGGIEDIVVTAQRRSENLQDVPVAVTAVSGDDLLSRGLSTATDLNMATPNLNVNRTVKTQIVYLRGVGNNSASPGQEQNVAIYVDGVYYPSMAANVFSFNNLQRIEILRGPQGTLFGRNTTGGLIQIVTKDPTQDFSGDFSIGYGSFDTVDVNAYVSGGVTDTLRGDIALQYSNQSDGWGRNVVRNEDVYKSKEFNIRSKWVFEPTDMTKFTLFGMYFRSNADFGTARGILPCAERLNGQSCVPVQNNIPGFNNINGLGFYDTQFNFPTSDRTRLKTASLRFDQDLGFARLVNISAYQQTKAYESLDQDLVPANRSTAVWTDITKSFSNEVQLQSPEGSPFEWIAGFYYFWSNAGNQPLTVGSPTTSTSIFSTLRTNSFSPFAQVGIPLGESTKLTLGGRYTVDKKTIDGRIVNNITNIATVTARQSRKFSEPTFRVALDHHLTDDVLLYASLSTGFKSGLFNAQSPTAAPVRPEKITAYEAGAKMDLFDRRIRFNPTIFYYDYRDLQLIGYTGTAIFLQNAANAEVYGAEVDMQAAIGSHLTLRGSAGYTHARYTDFPAAGSNSVVNPVTGVTTAAPSPGVDATGNRLSRTPTFTGNIGLDYSVPVSFGTIDFSTTLYHNSGFAWDVDNRLTEDAYQLVNASLMWTSENENFSLRAWVNNLTDTKYYASKQSGNNALDQGSPAAPRTYGLTAGFKF